LIFRTIRRIHKKIRPSHWTNFATISFSQNGEDTMLLGIFSRVTDGFFVDVGAHHPFRFSNTFLLYRRGWSGINIDALPGTKQRFSRARPRDLTIEMGVSKKPASLTYWAFEEPAYNTFDETLGNQRVQESVSKLIERTIIPTLPLADILDKHVEDRKTIDLLTVDVEGFDLQVLESNDWNRFRPKIVLCEVLGAGFDEMVRDPVYAYMTSIGYSLQSKLNTTAVFARDDSK
jgi:FkbM family methyltransferase